MFSFPDRTYPPGAWKWGVRGLHCYYGTTAFLSMFPYLCPFATFVSRSYFLVRQPPPRASKGALGPGAGHDVCGGTLQRACHFGGEGSDAQVHM